MIFFFHWMVERENTESITALLCDDIVPDGSLIRLDLAPHLGWLAECWETSWVKLEEWAALLSFSLILLRKLLEHLFNLSFSVAVVDGEWWY